MTTVETTNGHIKGRVVPPLPSFTFPDSGVTIQLRRISPDAQDQIARAVVKERERPLPPLQKVIGLDGKEVEEPNPDAPGYAEELQRYLAWLYVETSSRYFKLVLRQIVCEVDHDAVAALRDDYAAIGAPLSNEMDDREIYIRYICITSIHDLEALVAYYTSRTLPTEEAVRSHLDSFRG